MKQTAMQKHIEWLEDTIEIAEQQAPTLVNALNLCLNDAKHRLIMEKEQIIAAHKTATLEAGFEHSADDWANQYYNQTYKSTADESQTDRTIQS